MDGKDFFPNYVFQSPEIRNKDIFCFEDGNVMECKDDNGKKSLQKIPFGLDTLFDYIDGNILRYYYSCEMLYCECDENGFQSLDKPLKIAFPIPSDIQRNFQSIVRDSISERKEPPNLLSIELKNNANNVWAKRFCIASSMNSLFQWACTRRNDKSLAKTIQAHGVPTLAMIQCEDYADPNISKNLFFKFEDYISHELSTGLSLSIEIAAKLLEFDNVKLVNDVWKLFTSYKFPYIEFSKENVIEETLLVQIVKSRRICSRVAIDRKILDNIRVEYDTPKYKAGQLNPNIHDISQYLRYLWKDNFEDPSEIMLAPRENWQIEMNEAQRELSSIFVPYDFENLYHERSYYDLIPEDSSITLAVFCNLKHVHVWEYIMNNSKLYKASGINTETYKNMYSMVHSAVLEAIDCQVRLYKNRMMRIRKDIRMI